MIKRHRLHINVSFFVLLNAFFVFTSTTCIDADADLSMDTSTGKNTTLILETDAYFFNHGVLEPMAIQARSALDVNATLDNNGWEMMAFADPSNSTLVRIVAGLEEAGCFDDMTIVNTCALETFRKYNSFAKELATELERRHGASDSIIQCSSAENWVIFVRTGQTPQNMHYDEVKNSSYFRVWMPVRSFGTAPLLIANTTDLFETNSERLTLGRPGFTPNNRVISSVDFLRDCAAARMRGGKGVDGVCQFFHTLGMQLGQALAFRNGLVLHGNGVLGSGGTRVALAVDCWSWGAQDSDPVDVHDVPPSPFWQQYPGRDCAG